MGLGLKEELPQKNVEVLVNVSFYQCSFLGGKQRFWVCELPDGHLLIAFACLLGLLMAQWSDSLLRKKLVEMAPALIPKGQGKSVDIRRWLNTVQLPANGS